MCGVTCRRLTVREALQTVIDRTRSTNPKKANTYICHMKFVPVSLLNTPLEAVEPHQPRVAFDALLRGRTRPSADRYSASIRTWPTVQSGSSGAAGMPMLGPCIATTCSRPRRYARAGRCCTDSCSLILAETEDRVELRVSPMPLLPGQEERDRLADWLAAQSLLYHTQARVEQEHGFFEVL
jgi:hypothetical protein